MRKWIAGLMLTVLLTVMATGALAAGVTLRTFTPFADIDDAAQGYMDMITAWESEHGNIVEDYSGLTDEAWTQSMLDMVRSGEADIVVIPLNSGLTYEDLVTVDEVIEAVPDLGFKRFEALTESDSSVLLSPLRISWEALYINMDVMERCGVAVPTTYEELLGACSALAAQGVTPIANALGDWPEIVLDCAALASAPVDVYGNQESLDGAQQMLSALHALGAFGSDPFTGSDMDAMQAFINGSAAMRIDSDMLSHMLSAERCENVAVISLPHRLGESRSALVGVPGFGIAITRACWEDDDRLEAALSFIRMMLAEENYKKLAVGVEGRLGDSVYCLLNAATDCAGILYDRMDGSFDSWSQGVIQALQSP